MPRNRLLAGLAAIAILLVAIAWINGGPEEVRDITVPIDVPEASQ